MNQVGFLFDTDRCIGCNACRVACQTQNETGPDVAWRMVTSHEQGNYPDVVQYNLSIACNHCERPACMAVCPTNAITKRARDGIVSIDASWCNGCERCVGACPYGAPRIVPGRARVSKCDFCVARQDQGMPPACVETCVTGALMFGPVEAMPGMAPGRVLLRRVEGLPDPAWTGPSVRFVGVERGGR